MSRSAEVMAFVRGLEKVARAMATHQEKEIARKWANSSVKVMTDQAFTKAEERVSDAVVKQESVQVGTLQHDL